MQDEIIQPVYKGIHVYKPVNSPKVAELQAWKDKALPYLEDLLKMKELFGDHSYASHLRNLIKK